MRVFFDEKIRQEGQLHNILAIKLHGSTLIYLTQIST